MRRFALVLVLCLAVVAMYTSVAVAEETGGATYESPNDTVPGLADWLNSQEYLDHRHTYEEPKFALGVGSDLIVYEGPEKKEGLALLIPDAVTIEGRYDFNNETGSAYGVVTYNIWDMFAKK